MAAHPYQRAPDHAFWRRAMSEVAADEVDPVVSFPFRIGPADRVATAGSCFAQHIARHLRDAGFHHFVTEPGHPLLDAEVLRDFSYGVFSARFGNIYTSRQLLQLLLRACGEFVPIDQAWQGGKGCYDPYRPTIQPRGFATLAELRLDREQHLAAVRRMFGELDVLVFTLGLTEGFVNAQDGAAYPVCPGVAAGIFDQTRHRFVNEGVAEVVANLDAFLLALRRLNPRSRVILTVSPVPLIATAEPRHVLQ
jgi:hypothetical protein